MKKSKKLISSVLLLSSGILAIGFTSGYTTNTLIAKQTTYKQNNISKTKTNLNSTLKDDSTSSLGYDLVHLLNEDETQSGIAIKVPNFSSSESDAIATANTIMSAYNSVPSNVTTDNLATGLLSSLIYIDESIWQTSGASAPKIFNLGSTTTYTNNYQNASSSTDLPSDFESYNITSTTNLPAFNTIAITDENGGITLEAVTENYLNENGILALQISLAAAGTSTSSTSWTSFYVLISGFSGYFNTNLKSDNQTLDESLYSSGVKSVKDEDLINLVSSSYVVRITDEVTSATPTISLVSRTNDASGGTIAFTTNFSYTINEDLSFSKSFNGLTDDVNFSLTNTVGGSVKVDTYNQYNLDTNYDYNFSIKGFQPDPAISDTEVIIIVVCVIAVAVILSIIGFIASRISKRLRFKDAI